MNALLLFVVTICAVSVHCNLCPTNNLSDCSTMLCSPNFHRECVRGVCTCNPDNADHKCQSRTECFELYFNNTLDFCNKQWHCIDNVCKCGGMFGQPN